ncbi:hypothetical protein TNCV_3007571 [Trichonephila clavipes]|nr:hypothetical protein TNCV_3007571 [Trichonephila clavipes]
MRRMWIYNVQFGRKLGLHRNVGASRFNEPDGRQGCVPAWTVESNQGGRFDRNESVVDSFPSGAVSFKSSYTTILGAFSLLRLPEKNPPSGSELAARGHPSASSESVQELAARINKLGTQIFESSNTAQNMHVRNVNDQLLQSRFISGLRNDIRRFVLARDPNNLEESINAALKEEQNIKLNQIANDERTGLSPLQTKTSVFSALTNKLEEINLRVERLQEASSVTARKKNGGLFRKRETVFKCYYWGLEGHKQAEYKKRRAKECTLNYQPQSETPRDYFLFSVNQTLILSTGEASISKNRLFAIITQPPGIQQTFHRALPVIEEM